MNHETLLASTQHLMGAILQEHSLNLQEHVWMMNKGQREGKKHKSEIYDVMGAQGESKGGQRVAQHDAMI
eukprot:15329124-Ditylum_brightwellii.AAC.1